MSIPMRWLFVAVCALTGLGIVMTYSASAILRRYRGSPAPTGLFLTANLGDRHYARNLDRFYTCDWFVESGGGAATETARAAAGPR